MKVKWSHSALSNLLEIHEYVSGQSPTYALRLVDRITARSVQLSTFPESGGVVPEYADQNIREVVEGPYRIIYLTSMDQVTVLAVIHGSRLLPKDIM